MINNCLTKVISNLVQIKELLMTIAEVLAKIDAATSAIADRIQKLVDNTDNLTPEQTAAFQTEIDKLDAMGKDPNPAVIAG